MNFHGAGTFRHCLDKEMVRWMIRDKFLVILTWVDPRQSGYQIHQIQSFERRIVLNLEA